MTPEQFQEFRPVLPDLPGVYRYYDAGQKIIYIGKAKNLKKRVSSYFQKNDHPYRIQRMISQIDKIDFTIVDTEADAFLLENALIKEFLPRYNIQLRDDKTYPFIVIKNEDFPRVFFTRNKIRDGSEYLGPYTSVEQARNILSMLTQIFPLRSCNLQLTDKNISSGKFKLCLEYHIKRCMGPCTGLQAREEYMEGIQQIRHILRSDYAKAFHYLKGKMQEFADRLEFEKAQDFKEKLDVLTHYQSRSTIVNPKLDDLDVFGYTETEQIAFINYLKIKNGTVVRTRSYKVKKVLDEQPEDILLSVIGDNVFVDLTAETELVLPFAVSLDLPQCQQTVPRAGDKKKLLDLATRNALYIRQEYVRSTLTPEEKKPAFRIMKTLKDDLRLTEIPRHIECFDNSNFQGTDAVSACVVFREAAPSKKDYRLFNVRTVEGPDDFATMREVILRRYRRLLDEGESLPQLIIVDGGKGQLSAAVESLQELGLYGKVAIVGIAKRLEEIYFPEDAIPLHINKKSESLKLIQRMRDEAHRFGITRHRKKRSKSSLQSELMGVSGIGEKTFSQLLKHFKSVKKIREATDAEIEQLIGPSRAAALAAWRNKKEENETSSPPMEE